MNNIYALAGLLTYSPFALPSHPDKSGSDNEWTMVTELTAAGQFRIIHLIPF